MSGFAGVISSDGAPVDAELHRRVAERLAFRGPDATVVRVLDGAGFCFTLLRTGPAPQTDKQPFSLDERQWLLGDIRLDGRDDLRARLGRGGEEVPERATDEELALRAWRLRGPECGELLMGDYAFVIWEPAARRLVGLRDVIGARPFFYGQAGNTLCFGNTLDALRIVPGVDLRLDPYFIGDFLLQGWCSDLERTVHRGIRRLKPGHLLEFQNGVAATRRFTELPIKDPLAYSRAGEYVEQFQSLFQSAVRDRLPRDRVAFFMSGGLDSTSVAATAVGRCGGTGLRDISRAFTVDYRPLFDDPEAAFATKAASHIGIPIEFVRAGDERPFACWTDQALRYPEPLHEAFQSRHVQMCREVYAFARVGLSGDGGDEILSGTAVPYARYLARRGNFAELAKTFGGFVLRKRHLPVLGTGLKGRFRKWRSGTADESALPNWLRPEFVSKAGLQDRLAELHHPIAYAHPFHPRGYYLLAQGYWASVLEDEDAAWLGAPLERRAPFLDRRLVEFLLRVPPVPWCMKKELLREAMRTRVPEEVRARSKTPLRGEAFVLQAERLNWSTLPLPSEHPIVSEFVDWAKLEATLASVPGSQSWDHLRAISLNYWVKGVENEQVFL
jgi:asparagine synthase (glutamine-hydrolysing)